MHIKAQKTEENYWILLACVYFRHTTNVCPLNKNQNECLKQGSGKQGEMMPVVTKLNVWVFHPSPDCHMITKMARFLFTSPRSTLICMLEFSSKSISSKTILLTAERSSIEDRQQRPVKYYLTCLVNTDSSNQGQHTPPPNLPTGGGLTEMKGPHMALKGPIQV